MKVYLVLEPSYDWNDPLGVFSTEEKARRFVEYQYLNSHPRARKPPSWDKQHGLGSWCIEEYLLDSWEGPVDVKGEENR